MTEESLYHVKDAMVALRVSGSEIEHCRVCSSPNVRDTSGLESRDKARYGAKREREGGGGGGEGEKEGEKEREREREREREGEKEMKVKNEK